MEGTTNTQTTQPQTDQAQSSKRVWSLYYDNTEQKIAVYPFTSRDEILSTIRLIYAFKADQDLLFLDEDGIPTVLSPAIPTGTKLFIQKKEPVTDVVVAQMATNQTATPTWYWLQPSRNTHMRKNNNLTVYQPSNESQSHCFGSVVFKTGVHYFTLLFEPLECCVYAGVEDASKRDLDRFSSEFLDDNLKNMVTGKGVSMLSSSPTYELGFLINMENRTMTIVDHRAKKHLTKKEFTWAEVSPVVYFKHVVSITITSTSTTAPSWI